MAVTDKRNLYVELDGLLDSRLGTLAQMDETIATNVLENGYHQRLEDVFPGIDKVEYKQRYQARDVSVLQNTMMTNIFVLLRHLCLVMNKEEIQTQSHNRPTIAINVYPYELTAEEMDIIKGAVEVNMGGIASAEVISYDLKSLTPEHCKANYRFMMMYEWNTWMNAHATAFETTVLPEVALLAPGIFFADKPSDKEMTTLIQELREHNPKDPQPFRALETLASPIIDLHLIDIWYFSIVSDFSQTAHTSTLPDFTPKSVAESVE